MIFNEQLICRRKQMGLSQEQLGDKIGVTRQTVSKWELGETTPEMDKLISLSRLFGVSIDELVGNTECTQSGSLCLAQGFRGGFEYEYKSKKTFHGIPLVHVHYGFGMKRAHGIIAVGNIATGVVSVGLLSAGVVSLGVLSLGLIGFGSIVIGLLVAMGGIAAGTLALGGIAVGVLAIGGLSVGVYAYGGCAIAEKIARGGYAKGAIAIGDETEGEAVFDILVKGQGEAIKEAILMRFPKTWKIIIKLFAK